MMDAFFLPPPLPLPVAIAAISQPSLQGAIEFHVHSAPDIVDRKLDDFELVEQAANAKMKAVVLKNHVLPTADRAELSHHLHPDIEVFGGVVLNEAVGGLNPKAVEVMADTAGHRGKVVWLPTLDADYHRRQFGQPTPGIRVATGDRLLPYMEAVLQVVRDRDLILGTGHISPEEVLAVVRRSREMGIEKIVITHAMADVPGLSVSEMKTLAEMGAYLELDYVNALMGEEAVDPAHRRWHRVSVEEMAQAIRDIGAEHFILSTDLGRPKDPTPVDGYVRFVRQLQNSGISTEKIDVMARQNPARLLGI
ncbi:DUF6282 family protein [Baaleninema sp.]|uniref:DUF6282 family protein n=1 Tax=Baaleninema sp. TaxID=3101197 RepID=UPI003D03500F